MHARAPSATAFTTSEPRRTPPSRITSARPATASTISGRTSIGDGAWSSWRPPWFDTMIASMPRSTARRASAADMMPLSAIGPGQSERYQSMSAQPMAALNCFVVKAASEMASCSTPGIPTKLPKVGRGWVRKPRSQEGRRSVSRTFRAVIRGGRTSPLRTSRSRWPRTGVSTVTTRARYPAAFARSISIRTISRSRHT